VLANYRKKLAAGSMLLCGLAALPGEARGGVDLNWQDNDGTGAGWLAARNTSFALTLNISSSEATTGVDYFLESLNGSGFFIMQNRELVGSQFIDPYFTDSQVEVGPVNQLNPRTDLDLGASITNPNNPLVPGTYMLARYTFIVHPSTPFGTYNLTSFSNPETGWIDGSFNDHEFDHHADYAITVAAPQWNRDAGASWNTAGNWSDNIIPNSVTAVANFFDRLTGPATVSMDGNKTLLTMNIDSPDSYTISRGSGTLTMGGTTPAINVESGNHTISTFVTWSVNGTLKVNTGASLVLSGQHTIGASRTLNRTGAGMLTIVTGAQPHAVGSVFQFSGGTTNMNVVNGTAATALAPAVTNLTMNVSGDGAVVNLGADQNLRALNIAHGNAGIQGLNLNSPATAGAFRSLRVYAVDLAAAKTSIWASVINAAANPQDGIYDTGLPAHPTARVGIGIKSDLFGTQHVLVRPAALGDLNFDEQVSIADFLGLAGNFGSVAATWQEGDMNADGTVTIADFLALAGNFGALYSGGSVPISEADAALLSGFAEAHGVVVPEPGIAFLTASLAGILLYRRRRTPTLPSPQVWGEDKWRA
jgi:hypothetical protein